MALLLKRKAGERVIFYTDDGRITVAVKDATSLRIEAPRRVHIVREELELQEEERERR